MGSPKIIAKRGWAARGGIALARGSAGRGAPNGPRRGAAARLSAAPGLRSLCKARGEGSGGRGFGSSPATLDRRRRGGDAHRSADFGFDSGWGAGGDGANGCAESGEGVRERRSDSGRSESGPARPAKAGRTKARKARARRTEEGATPQCHAPQRRRRLAWAARTVFIGEACEKR